jgi:hypothetical protein
MNMNLTDDFTQIRVASQDPELAGVKQSLESKYSRFNLKFFERSRSRFIDVTITAILPKSEMDTQHSLLWKDIRLAMKSAGFKKALDPSASNARDPNSVVCQWYYQKKTETNFWDSKKRAIDQLLKGFASEEQMLSLFEWAGNPLPSLHNPTEEQIYEARQEFDLRNIIPNGWQVHTPNPPSNQPPARISAQKYLDDSGAIYVRDTLPEDYTYAFYHNPVNKKVFEDYLFKFWSLQNLDQTS